MHDNLIAATVALGFLIGIIGLCWTLMASVRNSRNARAQYGEYLEFVREAHQLSREGHRLQAEANAAMRELVAALRDKGQAPAEPPPPVQDSN